MKPSVHAPGYLSPPEQYTQGQQRRDRRERELRRFNYQQRSTTIAEPTVMETALRTALGPPETRNPPARAGSGEASRHQRDDETAGTTKPTGSALTLQGPARVRGKDGAA